MKAPSSQEGFVGLDLCGLQYRCIIIRKVCSRASWPNQQTPPPRNNEQWNVNRLRVLSGLVTLA